MVLANGALLISFIHRTLAVCDNNIFHLMKVKTGGTISVIEGVQALHTNVVHICISWLPSFLHTSPQTQVRMLPEMAGK